MSIDRRFALVADNGDVLFPVYKRQRATGREGFALSNALEHDRSGGGVYVTDLLTAVRHVVFDGWLIRVTTEGRPGGERTGSLGLGKRAVHRFWVAPELVSAVAGAKHERMTALPQEASSPSSALALAQRLSKSDYVRALDDVEGRVSLTQRTMLAAHQAAQDRTASMEHLAKVAGYDSFGNANLHYGKLGHLVGDALGIGNPGNWTQLLTDGLEERSAEGFFQWRLRPALAEALDELGWVDTAVSSPQAVVAQVELGSDPEFRAAPETVRRALVNARIGQGAYRRQMLRVWNGRCAVLGCSLPDVLIASHAKRWAESTNAERLDPYNGVLLTASLDRLFDRGIIGFRDDGSVVVRSSVPVSELEKLGIRTDSRLSRVHPRHLPYLQAHRAGFGLEG